MERKVEGCGGNPHIRCNEVRVFILSGRIETQAMAELRRLFELQTDYPDIVLDLKDVGVIDRDVMLFFMRCEADGVKLENCAPYIEALSSIPEVIMESDVPSRRRKVLHSNLLRRYRRFALFWLDQEEARSHR